MKQRKSDIGGFRPGELVVFAALEVDRGLVEAAIQQAVARQDSPLRLSDSSRAALRSTEEKPMSATSRPNFAAEQVERWVADLQLKHCSVLERKAFYHDNLWLLLVRDDDLGFYSVDIYRVNARQNLMLHGIFMEEADAREVFERVRL